jgi:hypothetical protein
LGCTPSFVANAANKRCNNVCFLSDFCLLIPSFLILGGTCGICDAEAALVIQGPFLVGSDVMQAFTSQ